MLKSIKMNCCDEYLIPLYLNPLTLGSRLNFIYMISNCWWIQNKDVLLLSFYEEFYLCDRQQCLMPHAKSIIFPRKKKKKKTHATIKCHIQWCYNAAGWEGCWHFYVLCDCIQFTTGVFWYFCYQNVSSF